MASAFNFNTPFESTGTIIEDVISGWAIDASDLVVGQVGPLIGTLFTIWVIYRALNIMYGVGNERVVDLFLDTVKLAAVGYFALNSMNYIMWVILNAPAVEDFLLAMVPNAPTSVWGSLDTLWDQGWNAIARLGSLESGISWDDFAGSLMLMSAMFFVACGIVFLTFMGLTLLVTNKVLLVILLGFGPLFLALGMFPKLREVMWSWVKMCLTCIFVMILFTAVVSLVVSVQTQLMGTMGTLALGGDAALMKAFQIGCILFVICCATGNIFQSIPFIARNLTGAWGIGGGTGGFATHAAAAGLGAVGGAMAVGNALGPSAGNLAGGIAYGARNQVRSMFNGAGGPQALAAAKAAGAAGASPAKAFGGFMKDLTVGGASALGGKVAGAYGAAKSFASHPGESLASAGAAIQKGLSETYNDGGKGFTSASARQFLADHVPNVSAGLEGAIAGARQSQHERTGGDSTWAAAQGGSAAAQSMIDRMSGQGGQSGQNGQNAQSGAAGTVQGLAGAHALSSMASGSHGGSESSSVGIAQWRDAGASDMNNVGKSAAEVAAASAASGTDANGIVNSGGSQASQTSQVSQAGVHAAAAMQGASGVSGANGTSGTSGVNGTGGVSGRNGIDGAPGASAPASSASSAPSGSAPSAASASAAAAMAAGSSASSASSASPAPSSASSPAYAPSPAASAAAASISTAGSSSDSSAAAAAATSTAGTVSSDGSSQSSAPSGASEHSISAMGSSTSSPSPDPSAGAQGTQAQSQTQSQDDGAQVLASRSPRMRRG